MKKVAVKLNTKPEKIIACLSLSAAGTILFHKKGKSFFKKLNKNYKVIDNVLSMTVARDVAKNEKIKTEKEAKEQFKTKLKDLEIENAEFIDLSDCKGAD